MEKYNFVHFGAGDLLREEIKKENDVGKMIKSIIDEGKIVPSKITCELIQKKMDEFGKDKTFLIDGYPRNNANLEAFESVFGNTASILCTLYLTCDQETCVNRILGRSETSNRSDDKQEIVVKRFKYFF